MQFWNDDDIVKYHKYINCFAVAIQTLTDKEKMFLKTPETSTAPTQFRPEPTGWRDSRVKHTMGRFYQIPSKNYQVFSLSKELNHFRVIAAFFRDWAQGTLTGGA